MIIRSLSNILVANRTFVIPYLVTLCGGALAMMLNTKEELFLAINGLRNQWADYFFQYFTHVGDGLFFIGAALLLLLYNVGRGTIAFAAFLLSGLIAQVLKKLVYPEALRPAGYFSDATMVESAEGTYLNVFNSFPSGHATTTFALFFLLTAMSRNKQLGYLFFMLAVLASYSRIYLGQHFFEDVYFGSFIGFFSGAAVWVAMTPLMHKPWAQKSFLRKSQ
jgi:membrane-associated phospholipid phosphatase